MIELRSAGFEQKFRTIGQMQKIRTSRLWILYGFCTSGSAQEELVAGLGSPGPGCYQTNADHSIEPSLSDCMIHPTNRSDGRVLYNLIKSIH